VDGNQGDNSLYAAGAVYVLARNGTSWTHQAYLKGPDPDHSDYFGVSVGVSADTVAVGAHFEDSNASGVNGDPTDNSLNNSGAAFAFVWNGSGWSQQAYLKASNADSADWFGRSVAISEDMLVVGAWGEDSNATDVNDNQLDNSSSESGAAYAFTRSGSSWSQLAYLKASNTDPQDGFGKSVALSGSTVVIGAENEDSPTAGVDGPQDGNGASNAGAAYIYGPGTSANFAGSPTSGDEDHLVYFTDLSTGPGLSHWYWSFGDTGTSTLANPTHLYVDPGTYTVSLSVTGTDGSNTKTRADYIAVNDLCDPGYSYYNGTGINPSLFTTTDLPTLGTTWTSQIDGSSVGASGLSFAVGYSSPSSGVILGAGELLIDVTSAWLVTSISGGAGGITTHSLALPPDSSLAGFHAYLQGYLNNVGGAGLFCNAIDLVLGS